MSNVVIQVEELSKIYRIGLKEEIHDNLVGAVVDFVKRPVTNLKRLRKLSNFSETSDGSEDIVWAVKDVSFEVKQGEVVGIIGCNGAGKSTLLKILCRITEPTSGRAIVEGRVGSLLEVGTGFHPELTGRENVYLNGVILGMKKAEVEKKFGEIVAFSEVGKFIDTPVKRYSSGMKVRLAFAVAAHLEPEILLVDEVLAVGDAAFQKKCLGKMQDVASEGRTVLFVSHNMVAMQSLCSRVIWLDEGKKKEDGQASQVVSDYLKTAHGVVEEQVWEDMTSAPGDENFRLRRVRVLPQNGSMSDGITMEVPFVIECEYWNLLPDARLHITLHILNEQGIIAFTSGSALDPVWKNRPLQEGLYKSVCHIPGNLLNSGRHQVKLLVVKDRSRVIYRHENAASFDILDLNERPVGGFGREPGVVQPLLQWTTEGISKGIGNENSEGENRIP